MDSAHAPASPIFSRLAWAARTAAYVAVESRIPYLDSARLERLRDARVRSIAAHAYRTVPHYRQAMDEARILPRDIRTVSDLAQLPLVTGRDLAADPDRFTSTQYARKNTLELLTSGSTGHSKRIRWDKAAVFRSHAAGLRHRDVLAEFVGRHSGYRLLTVNHHGGTSSDVSAFHHRHSWVPAAVDPHTVMLSPKEPFEQAVAAINAHRPDVIRGFGAYIGAIYRWAWTAGHEVHRPSVICYGGEHMHEADRRLLSSRLGIPVITSYQSCEAMRMAFQCERAGGLHISSDLTDIRIVNDRGETAGPGQAGRVVISNLVNRATVLLNYDIGDIGTFATEACGCGRTLPILERLEGRADDFVVLPGGEVAHDSVILSALYRVPGLVRLQLVQHELRLFEVKVVCDDRHDWDETRQALETALRKALAPHSFDATWRRVDRIDPGPGGKFKCVVSRLRDGNR